MGLRMYVVECLSRIHEAMNLILVPSISDYDAIPVTIPEFTCAILEP